MLQYDRMHSVGTTICYQVLPVIAAEPALKNSYML